MELARRLFAAVLASALFSSAQEEDQTRPQQGDVPRPGTQNDDRLPNGKSRSDAVADDEHKKAVEEAGELVKLSQDLRQEIIDAGKFVVPVQAVRKTEEIEKLARKIRGRLKV